MIRYPALIDGERGAYGIAFPDLPGIVAMGETIDEALRNAEEALLDYAVETEIDGDAIEVPSTLQSIAAGKGSTLIAVPLVRRHATGACPALTLDQAVIAFIDSEAGRRGMTRTAFVAWMERRLADIN